MMRFVGQPGERVDIIQEKEEREEEGEKEQMLKSLDTVERERERVIV